MGEIPSNLVMWSGVVGFLLPLGISLILQQGWSDGAKSVVAFVCCLVAAAGTAYFSGNFDGTEVLTALLIVFTLAQVTYRGIWRPTGVSPALEAATSR